MVKSVPLIKPGHRPGCQFFFSRNMTNSTNSTKVLAFCVLFGCLGFTAKTSPEAFSAVSIASMRVLTVLVTNQKEGKDNQ